MFELIVKFEYGENLTEVSKFCDMNDLIYLDNAATTKVSEKVCEIMSNALCMNYANPSGAYTFSSLVRHDVEKARKDIAGFIGAEADEIVFTSGGTESDNYAIKGIVRSALSKREQISVITSYVEHEAVLESIKALKEEYGNRVTVIYLKPGTDGRIDLEELKQSIRPDTVLVSVMMANNEIGTIEDIEAITEIAHVNNIVVHTDAVQAFGHIPIDVRKLKVDLLSASAHKLHGPKGIGLLYVKRTINPIIFINGGGQEKGRRSGTENTPGILGFAKAVEEAKETIAIETVRSIKLRDYIIDRIITEIPDVILTGASRESGRRLPGHASFCFKNIEGPSLVVRLDMKGICCSTGSACNASSLKPSHVLSAIGISDEWLNGSLRITLSRYTTEEEVKRAVDEIVSVVTSLRQLMVL